MGASSTSGKSEERQGESHGKHGSYSSAVKGVAQPSLNEVKGIVPGVCPSKC